MHFTRRFQGFLSICIPKDGLVNAGDRRQAEHERNVAVLAGMVEVAVPAIKFAILKPSSFVLFLLAMAAILMLVNLSLWGALKTRGAKPFNEL